MSRTDEAILTFAEAFSRLGDRKHSELTLEALASIVRLAKAEERQGAQETHESDAEQILRLYAQPARGSVMH